MGGSSMQEPLNPNITAQLDRARAITEQQIRAANDLAMAAFGMRPDQAVVAAIIQALATNYLATVQANKAD